MKTRWQGSLRRQHKGLVKGDMFDLPPSVDAPHGMLGVVLLFERNGDAYVSFDSGRQFAFMPASIALEGKQNLARYEVALQ